LTRNVFIVGPSVQYKEMFEKEGWKVVNNVLHCDLIQFTGGEDVNPALYNEPAHKATYFNPHRDEKEQIFFSSALKARIPMAGICRGGQFLNVMNGGRMWQHVDGHAIQGTHECKDVHTGEVFQVTSTHHQMMIPHETAVVIGITDCSRVKERMRHGFVEPISIIGKGDSDYEILFYPTTESLCFQPQPEFDGYDELRQRYFSYIDEYLFR
jgi:hypothetical protein